MSRIFRLRFLTSQSDNPKPVLSQVEGSKTYPFDKLRAGSDLCRRLENSKWVGILAIAVTFAMCVAVVEAQQPTKILRIGFLDISTAASITVFLEAFRQEMRKLGWIEGKNITIEYRFAEQKTEHLPELAAELVRLKVDLIVTSGAPTARVAKEATSTIPIVMASSVDPVGEGLIASLARREAISPVSRG